MNKPTIVAIMATHARECFLLNRALPSILSQSRFTDAIIVVDDGETPDLLDRIKAVVPTAQYLSNRRTPGLSGALNTGLDHLARITLDPTGVFVAFLDDDDEWMPEHLAAIESHIIEGAEVVATPFLRLETNRDAQEVTPSVEVTPDLFMERNPGIQGSTFIARLDILLEAGGFNEAMKSCTDRDLWIRLCRRPGIRYATTSVPSVLHYACADRLRLSSPGSEAKRAGLEMFDRIHSPIMKPSTRAKHLKRAARLFDWYPTYGLAEDRVLSEHTFFHEAKTPHLLIGIIADDRRLPMLSRLLDDLADQVVAERIEPPDVLLLENRPKTTSGQALSDLVSQKQGRLRIRLFDRVSLDRIVEAGEWHPEGSDLHDRLAIADARTALQTGLYYMARERPGCAVWILDDDMRLDPIIAKPSGLMHQTHRLGQALRRMRATGADICIGSYTGAPPLPAVASIRGQLVDLIWNLRRISSYPPEAPLPPAEPHNAALRAKRRDYYHDLSHIETDRLETPFAIEQKYPDERCGTALARLGAMIPRILAGEAPLRPLVAEPDVIRAFATTNALHRGGNTFVFDPEALFDLPNISPTVEGRPARRSDMIWALLQKRRCDRNVISVPFPVRHDRSDMLAPDVLDHAGIADDIRGFSIFSALQEAGEDAERIENLCSKYEEERLAALRLSFHRIRGLARELLSWSQNEAPAHVPHMALSAQAQQLLVMFSPDQFTLIETSVHSLGPVQVRNFLAGLDARITAHTERLRSATELPRLMMGARVEAARSSIGPYIHPEAILRVLGQGSEGVSFTDGKKIWKLFDQWSTEQATRTTPVLEKLIDTPFTGTALIKPLALTRIPAGWLLTLPFEASQHWTGGYGPGLIELIANLHEVSLVCRNLHPKNLRIVNDSVRLIDYGSDIIPLDDPNAISLEFLRMCRRAWLCWRWWWRDDLDQLMHRSLHDTDLPELDGHENLIRAVRERLGLNVPRDPTITRALALRPTRVLDYGAGKGKQAAKLANSGAEVVAWDPDSGVASRLEKLAPLGVHRAISAAEATTSGPFDLVICRRVACLIDDAALDTVLRDLRAALTPNGRVLFAICHPAYTHRVRLVESEPLVPPCSCGAAPWTKKVRATGRVLHEVHRSERLLRRRLMRAGFRIHERYERFCTELERFETVADLLVLELTPAPMPEVSLLIKACAMDAEALDLQVRDMLTALEEPEVFSETVLALDIRTENFPRAHTVGDLSALREVAKRLIAEGEIDRIIEPPSSTEELSALNHRWFGLDLPASHSTGGAATGALLSGFDACNSPYVLHADLDMMIGCTKRNHSPLRELLEAVETDSNALTASFPVARAKPCPWTAEGPYGPWRVESRLGLVCLERLRAILPLPNAAIGQNPCLSWHRAMDEAVRQGQGTSLRGGEGRSFCVHPPNARKQDIEAWEEVRAAVARGCVPPLQHGKIEWSGTPSDWRYPERYERFIFIICGRNVTPERFRRCWDSVIRQNRSDWGAVVIDDSSDPWITEELDHILAAYQSQVSFITRRRRAGLLANTVYAVRHMCASPDQIMVTLDADDHLIGCGVLDHLAEIYDDGADLTVGSMLRTDKNSDYKVNLDNPRHHRGGNVWQHLRSFRKKLFDALPDHALRLNGKYVDLASDWAFMLPMVEMAHKPVWIHKPLYLHEPGESRDHSRASYREAVITQLIAKGAQLKETAR